MSIKEVALVDRQFRERLRQILSAEHLRHYHAYQRRLEESARMHTIDPVIPTNEQQVALDMISADTQASALRQQLFVLLRIESLPS